nr:reverse transcriptase domain-containing protein [Tanacetum cinerariifolium]
MLFGLTNAPAVFMDLMNCKNIKFEWGDEQEIAFLTLKDMLCDAPILALSKGADDFVVYCDASNQGKANVVADALSRKEWMKPRRARAMSMTIHSSIKAKILEAHSEASKGINTLAEMLKGLDKPFERKEDGILYLDERIWVPVYGNLRTLIMNEAHATRFASLYIDEIVAGHGVPVSIIYDRDSRFTLRFWPSLKKALGTRLEMSTAYHPQTDGQSERTIQTLKDMFRACAMDFWCKLGYSSTETTDKIVQIKERLKTARVAKRAMPIIDESR